MGTGHGYDMIQIHTDMLFLYTEDNKAQKCFPNHLGILGAKFYLNFMQKDGDQTSIFQGYRISK